VHLKGKKALRSVFRFSFYGFALSALLPFGAADAATVTLRQAYDRMMSGEIEFQVLDLERSVAAELARQARGALKPRVMLNFEYNFIDQDVVSSDNQSYAKGASRYGTMNVALTMVQPLYDAARWRQMAVADAQAELVRAKAEEARNALIGQMAERFLDVAQAQFMLTRSGHISKARRDFVALLNAQMDAGRADLSTLLRAEGEILSAESDRSSAEMAMTEALFELARFTGGDVTGVSLSDNRFGVVDSANLHRTLTRERLMAMSPQVQIAEAELVVAQKVLARTHAGYLPTVNLKAELGLDHTDGSLFGGGSQISTNKIGVGVEVPIYQGGVQQSRMREERMRVEIAERRLELSRRVVERQYEALVAAERRASERLGVLSRQKGSASQALLTVQAEEGAGRVSADTVLERRLNSDVIDIELQVARLQQLRLQMRLFALFGALDVTALSRQLNG